MVKISSFYTISKTYLKRFLGIAEKSAEKSVNTVEQVIQEPQKVTSKQIEAYYKRYGNILEKKPKPEVNKPAKNPVDIEAEKILKEEMLAYNMRRFFSVSQEAIDSMAHNFETKRKQVTDIILSCSDILPEEYIKAIKNIKNPKELVSAICSFTSVQSEYIVKKYPEMYKKLLAQRKISLEDQQTINKMNEKTGKAYIDMIKAVSEPSKDKRVIQIENYIKKMYDIDFVHLENFEEAQRVLASIKIALRHNLPMPENIIVSPYQPYMAGGVNISTGKTRSIIFLSEKERRVNYEEAYSKFISPKGREMAEKIKKSEEKYASTNHPLHGYIHEFCHSAQTFMDIFPLRLRKIPAKYVQTAKQVGEYANTSVMELDAELRAKSILSSLSEDEKALFDYLN